MKTHRWNWMILVALGAGCVNEGPGGFDRIAEILGRSVDGGESCVATRCGPEVSACGEECRRLLECLADCPSGDCAYGCYAFASDEAAAQLEDVFVCYDRFCEAPDAGATPGTTPMQDTGAWNGGRQDLGVRDAGSQDLGVRDAGSQDLGVRDAGSQDLGVRDAGSQDLGGWDAGRQDLGSWDAGRQDLGSWDAGRQDLGSWDAGRQDLGVWDAGM